MLTIFTIPKPFKGHIDIIQTNAIQSWRLLHPICEIILFGDEEGTARTAAAFDAVHVPDIERNKYGTPLLDSIIEKVKNSSDFDGKYIIPLPRVKIV